MTEVSFLKRGKGKTLGNIKKKDFFKYYIKNSKEPQVTQSVYNSFLKDLLSTYSTLMVTEGLEVKINQVGRFRIRSRNLQFFRKDESFKKLRPNWNKSWEYWHSVYPDLTKDEITQIKNKTLIYHDNEHTQNEFYEHHWDKLTNNLKYKSFYTFKAPRQYSRLIAKIVKDPNRKTFYYG